MKRLLLALVFVFVLAGTASAQQVVTNPAAVKIAFDHPGDPALVGFRLFELQGSNHVQVGSDIAPDVRQFPFPALTPGTHDLVLRSVYQPPVGEFAQDSNVLSVRVVVLIAPSNLRLALLYIDGKFSGVRVL